MVQFFHVGPSRSAMLQEQLGQSLGQGLSNFAGDYFANKSLQSVIDDPSLKDAPVSKRLSALQGALAPHGERGQRMLQQRLGIEQQKLQEEQLQRQQIASKLTARVLGGESVIPEEMAGLPPEQQINIQKLQKSKKQATNMTAALKRSGVPDEMAEQFGDVYESATEGGKTELLKQYNEMLKRGRAGYFKNYNKDKILNGKEPELNQEWPEIEQPEGMTPAEEVKLQGAREDINSKIYEDINSKVGANENESRAVDRLSQLNESKKLPEGLGKWDINWETGEPRFSPGTLPPEAQLFIKTINDFTVKAKDTFGSRVTNFDLQAFMKRLPTLANSYDGRKLILKQMELANKLANLKDETLRDAFDHYGLGGASNQQIRKIANDKYKQTKPALEERLKNLDGLLEQEYEKENTRLEKVEPGTKLEPKTALEFLNQAGGNREEAEKKAKEAGYEF